MPGTSPGMTQKGRWRMDDLTSDRPDRAPTHPGAIWREDILPALGLTVAGAARDLLRLHGFRALGRKPRRRLRPRIVAEHPPAGLPEKVPAHRLAHYAEPDESDCVVVRHIPCPAASECLLRRKS